MTLAGGALVIAFCSGTSASADRLLRVVPPQVGHTPSANGRGQFVVSIVSLCGVVRPHSTHTYGTSTDATAIVRAIARVSPAVARYDSLTSTSVTAGTWLARLFSSRFHWSSPAGSNRDTSARSITTSPSAPTRNGRARNIEPIVPMIRKYVTEPWTSLMIRGGFSAALSCDWYRPCAASSCAAAGPMLVAAYLLTNAK